MYVIWFYILSFIYNTRDKENLTNTIVAISRSNLHTLTFLLVFSFLFLYYSAWDKKTGTEFAGSIYFTFCFLYLRYLFKQA